MLELLRYRDKKKQKSTIALYTYSAKKFLKGGWTKGIITAIEVATNVKNS